MIRKIIEKLHILGPQTIENRSLQASLGSFGVSWAVLARLRRIWGVLWVRLGTPEGVLEAS